MGFSLFSAIGGLLATGSGVLLLAMLAASIVLIWDWRWGLAGALLTLLGASSILAALHTPATLVTASQWLAVVVATTLLALAGWLHPASAGAHANHNWLLRLIALVFSLGAWWVIDPGVTLPMFTQVETDLIFWIGLCGLLILSMSTAPLQAGIGLLLLTAPVQAIAPVLLPESGVAVIAGIAQILLALACAYLTLTPAVATRARRPMLPLPGARTAPTATARRRRPFFRPQPLTPAQTLPAAADPRREETPAPLEESR